MSPSSQHHPTSPSGKAIVRESLSGPCAGGNPTATTNGEKPRRQTTGMRSRAAIGRCDRGPRPHVSAHGPLNEFRTMSPAAKPRHHGAVHAGLAHEPNAWRDGQSSPVIGQTGKSRCGKAIARESLSGSCAGDYLTATTVKEKPRRQTAGSRLRATLGRSDCGPCPPVCAHGPLNDSRALFPPLFEGASHCTPREPRQTLGSSTYRNGSQLPAGASGSMRVPLGTNRRRTTYQ